MPMSCCVVKCSMRSERDQVRFFRIPTGLKNRGDYLNALSKQRHDLWVRALKRGPLSESMLRNARICSRHFLLGQPAPLENKNNQDWVPNQNMGYAVSEKKDCRYIIDPESTRKKFSEVRKTIQNGFLTISSFYK